MEWRSAAGRRLLLLLGLLLLGLGATPPVDCKEITHEDIKDAMLSLVHLMRDNTEKLERHEARDRQTDEQLKKALALLTKRVSSADALKSYLLKLEERLAGLEQLQAQRDERERAQLQKTADALEDLESRLEGWATEIEAKIQQASRAPELLARIDAAEAKLLARLEQPSPTAAAAAAEPELLQQLRDLGEQLRSQTSSKQPSDLLLEQLRELPKTSELRAWHNQSQTEEQQTRELLKEALDSSQRALQSRLAEDRAQAREELGSLRSEVGEGSQRLAKELHELNKGQAVMMEMADHVLDTKKRLEHAYKILREVGELVMAQGINMNNTLNARFDGISNEIMDNQRGALGNLTSKMEQEMNQVWRQINVMYQQMMESAKALDKLHKQNEAYVNGTTETMDGMEGKVGEITKRMSEVDTNLNYLLGRLSLVTQEFNQIKEGLGAALDNIKASFKEVQDKANDLSPSAAPGPHPLPRNYNEPDATASDTPPFSVNLPSSS